MTNCHLSALQLLEEISRVLDLLLASDQVDLLPGNELRPHELLLVELLVIRIVDHLLLENEILHEPVDLLVDLFRNLEDLRLLLDDFCYESFVVSVGELLCALPTLEIARSTDRDQIRILTWGVGTLDLHDFVLVILNEVLYLIL